jgi:hypothetical protein
MRVTGGEKLALPVYRAYRCGNPDYTEPTTISAPLVEGVVVGAVKEAIADVEGRRENNRRYRERKRARLSNAPPEGTTGCGSSAPTNPRRDRRCGGSDPEPALGEGRGKRQWPITPVPGGGCAGRAESPAGSRFELLPYFIGVAVG